MDELICGDVFELLSTFEDKKFDCIITDPEYDKVFDISLFERICKGNIIAFCKPENQFFVPDEYLFWIKTPSTKNFVSKCGRFVEMILVRRQGSVFNKLHWSQMIGVHDDKLILPTIHPWEKPLTLIERLIRIYSNAGDVVFDPFCGSGTTLIAAKNTGRHYLGIDINPDYIKLADDRLTGRSNHDK